MKTAGAVRPSYLVFFSLCACLTALPILYPTIRMLIAAVQTWDTSFIIQRDSLNCIRNTVVLGLSSVFSAGISGTLLAMVTHRYRFTGKAFVEAMAMLPLALPPLVGVLAFYYLIGRDGVVARAAERIAGVIGFYPRGLWGILIIHTYSFYVFFYSAVGNALNTLDHSLIEAARNLGASRWRTFRTVTVPLLMPAFQGAALLTFMSSCASFSAPLFLGEGFPVLSVRIYEASSQFRMEEAQTLTLTLAAVSLGGILLFRVRDSATGASTKGTIRTARKLSLGIFGFAFIAAVLCVILVPYTTILWLAFVDHSAWHTELIPHQMTTENFAALFQSPDLFAPFKNSLRMSTLATLAVMCVALPIAHWIAQNKQGTRWLNILVMIPWALPGSVIAMNLLSAFNDPWIPQTLIIGMLPLGYFVRSIPLFTRMMVAAFQQFDTTLLDAARTLGASPWFRLKTVIAPLIGPALAASTALVFAGNLGEFVISILLYRPENLPVAVHINMLMRGIGVGTAFACSAILLLFNITAFAIAKQFSSRLV